MTISTITAKSRYAGDGITTAFPTGFKFFYNDHVRVLLRAADGSEALWSEGSEYSLTGAGAPGGGTVHVVTDPSDHTPAPGETLVVKLAVPPRQETSLPLGGAFPSTAVEGMADLAALRDQQIEEALSRAPKFGEATAQADVAFPEPAAGKVIGWNAGADGLVNASLNVEWSVASGAPLPGSGGIGDFQLDSATGNVYEKTLAADWMLRANIKGPQGGQGDKGDKGDQGATGAQGEQGPQGDTGPAADSVIMLSLGDEHTVVTAGSGKLTFRMPMAFTLSSVRAGLKAASSAGAVTLDLNENGSSILSTKLTIDQGEKTSTTAATPAVISDASLADDAEITVDIDGAGSGAVGLKVTLIGMPA